MTYFLDTVQNTDILTYTRRGVGLSGDRLLILGNTYYRYVIGGDIRTYTRDRP